jgi:hypothetical protein
MFNLFAKETSVENHPELPTKKRRSKPSSRPSMVAAATAEDQKL